ncbi:MAG: hypothetical protein GEU28_12840 [Dehalococcoidia bacterium]|nr:hypothetical protein [Dehalococcoidia bacterium]
MAGESEPHRRRQIVDNLVGVRFKEAGRIYYFEPGEYDLDVGEYVIVETARGAELGTVVIAPGQVIANELDEEIKQIVRLATDDDLKQQTEWRTRERDTTVTAREAVGQSGLPMRIISSEYNLDGSRLTLYFESEERIDFRDLIRDLSRTLDTRVEMRQVGPRDRAKLADGYGRCGERLCCSSWLTSFPTISIKMAKEQGLPLNPGKISGVCGRLLCCLIYEHDVYKHIRGSLPRVGQRVTTPFGDAKVVAIDTLKEKLTFQLDDLSTIVLPASEVGYGTVVRPADEPPKMPRYVEIAERLSASSNLLAVVDTPEQDAAYGEAPEAPSQVSAEPDLEPPADAEVVGGGDEEPSSEEAVEQGLAEAAIEGEPHAELEAQAPERESGAADPGAHTRRRRGRRRRGGRGKN